MEKCFFNNCVLNDEEFMKKYKKQHLRTKKIMINFEFKDEDIELIKMTGIMTKVKKIYMCCEHVEIYQKLKSLKPKYSECKSKHENPSKDNKLSSDDLEQYLLGIISLTRFDSFLRRLIPIYFDNFLNFLMEIFNKFGSKINNFILIIIFNLLKELAICDKYGEALYNSILQFLFQTDIILYQDPAKDKKKVQNLSTELDISCFLYSLQIINIIYSNLKEKIDIDLTFQLIDKLLYNIKLILVYNDITNPKFRESERENDIKLFKRSMEISLFDSIITVLNCIMMSKHSNIDTRVTITNFTIDHSDNLFIFSLDSDESTVKLMLCFNYEIIYFIYNSKQEYFSQRMNNYINDLNNYWNNLTNNEHLYLKVKVLNTFNEKIIELSKLVEQKINRHLEEIEKAKEIDGLSEMNLEEV